MSADQTGKEYLFRTKCSQSLITHFARNFAFLIQEPGVAYDTVIKSLIRQNVTKVQHMLE